jgi:peptide/nickel transport system substrate-binding protein
MANQPPTGRARENTIMLTRRTWLAGTAAMPCLHYAALAPSASAQTPRDVLVMGKGIDDIISLDPAEAFEYSGTEIGGNCYQTLVTTPNSDPAKLVGEVAEAWEVSNDAKTYTFRIRQGLKFASGQPVTAGDAAYSIARVVTLNKTPAFIINQFGFNKDNVARLVTAPDARTLVISLERPTSPSFLMYCLSANVGAVVERAVVQARAQGEDWGNGWLKQNSAGSGPFAVRQWRASEQVQLDANTHYATPAKMRRVIIRHIPDPSAQLLQLTRGDLDIARNLGADQIRSVSANSAFTVQPSRKASLMYIGMNQRHPALARPEVRQAIKWAIDYEGIQKNIVSTTYSVHQAFLPAGFPSALENIAFRRDVAKARALLAQAGFGGGFEVTLDHSSSSPLSDIAQAVQANLAEVGIKVTLAAGEMRQVVTKTRARQHQMALVRWGADYFDPHTNAETFAMNPDNGDDARNRTLAWRQSWEIPEMTRRVAANVLETDVEKRRDEYLKLQAEHQETSPFAIMLQEIEVAVLRANVSGLDLGPMSDRTRYVGVTKS